MPRSVKITAPHVLTRMLAPSARRPKYQRVEHVAFEPCTETWLYGARRGRDEIHLTRRPAFDEAAPRNLDDDIYLQPHCRRVTINGPNVVCVVHPRP